MGWLIYSTAPNHISQRGSRCTILTNPGALSRLGRFNALVRRFIMLHSVGSYDLAEHLIMQRPEQVNARGGRNLFPLPAALYKSHFCVANLLRKHGAVVDVRGDYGRTPLFVASIDGSADIMQWLLDQGADPNCENNARRTPLHVAAYNGHFEAIEILLKHNADIDSQNLKDETPLCYVLTNDGSTPEGQVADRVRRLLEHGADTNICNHTHSTAIHKGSSRGWLEVAQLLLSYGAKVDEKDKEGRTPLELAASHGHPAITKLLLEHGAVPQP